MSPEKPSALAALRALRDELRERLEQNEDYRALMVLDDALRQLDPPTLPKAVDLALTAMGAAPGLKPIDGSRHDDHRLGRELPRIAFKLPEPQPLRDLAHRRPAQQPTPGFVRERIFALWRLWRRPPGRDLLRRELAQFVVKPGARGRLRLEAARGHDDLVIAAALGVLAADLATSRTSKLFGATVSP
jgi:hypothetical protein